MAAASPSQVAGGACGYYTNVSLFGGPPELRGCGQTIPPGDARSASPSVALPDGGSTAAITAADSNGALAQYGPATVFGGKPADDPNAPPSPSGPLKASTKGKRTVTSSASVKDVGAGPFSADSVASTCHAAKGSLTASTTITKGVLVTATDADGNPTKVKEIPTHPAVNQTITGKISTGDSFRAVFNEQKVSPEGKMTVNAVHLYLLGPTAVGDVVIAESNCKV